MKKLILNHELYSSDTIYEAKRAYRNIANIAINEKKNCYVVRFFNCRYDSERTIREFENYLIGLENMKV